MPNSRIIRLQAVVFLTFILSSVAQAPKEVVKDVLALVAASQQGKEVTTEARQLSKKFNTIAAVMRLYNKRDQGGIGFGPKGVRMERRLIDLEEDGISAETLKHEANELRKLAHVNLILAEASRAFAPTKEFQGRGKKEWLRDLDAVQSASRELLKAIESNDPKAVQTAATTINKACTRCHEGQR